MIIKSVENGPLIGPTVEENGVTRSKKYVELSVAGKIQADCDMKATNIILQGPTHRNHGFRNDFMYKTSLIMVYYLALILTSRTFFVSTGRVPSVRYSINGVIQQYPSSYTTASISRSSIDFLSNIYTKTCLVQGHALFFGFISPVDLIRHEAGVHFGYQGRQRSFAAGTSRTRANISGIGGNNSGQQRVVKCFNYQREGRMARQCPKPKRRRDATWFRDKVLMVEAHGKSKVLNEEELEFMADPVLMANLSSYRSDVLSE
nr:hypothetical protein [Tanacetum cinerariifolium]